MKMRTRSWIGLSLIVLVVGAAIWDTIRDHQAQLEKAAHLQLDRNRSFFVAGRDNAVCWHPEADYQQTLHRAKQLWNVIDPDNHPWVGWVRASYQTSGKSPIVLGDPVTRYPSQEMDVYINFCPLAPGRLHTKESLDVPDYDVPDLFLRAMLLSELEQDWRSRAFVPAKPELGRAKGWEVSSGVIAGSIPKQVQALAKRLASKPWRATVCGLDRETMRELEAGLKLGNLNREAARYFYDQLAFFMGMAAIDRKYRDNKPRRDAEKEKLVKFLERP